MHVNVCVCMCNEIRLVAAILCKSACNVRVPVYVSLYKYVSLYVQPVCICVSVCDIEREWQESGLNLKTNLAIIVDACLCLCVC